MFRQFARLPLRRCLHSQASSSPRTFARHSRSAYALGASVAVAGYLAWSLSSNGRHLSLDAEPAPTSKKRTVAAKTASSQPSDAPTLSKSSASQPDAPELDMSSSDSENPSSSTLEALAEGEGEHAESSSGGAFNPETGEINWDCPCLGGMAHGPCGQQFRDAFSCFVYSEAEPKGMDCVEKFKAMQDCFREHPDVYGDEIMDDDDDDELPAGAVTTENPEGQTTLSDTLSTEVTEPKPTSTSS